LKETEVTQRLKMLGAAIYIGHQAQHMDGAHVVVTSTAVDQQNPEVIAARAQNVPVIPRIEMLAEIARLKYTIAIAGTTAKRRPLRWSRRCCRRAGWIDGDRRRTPETPEFRRAHGPGRVPRCRSDESDGSFLKLSPASA